MSSFAYIRFPSSREVGLPNKREEVYHGSRLSRQMFQLTEQPKCTSAALSLPIGMRLAALQQRHASKQTKVTERQV